MAVSACEKAEIYSKKVVDYWYDNCESIASKKLMEMDIKVAKTEVILKKVAEKRALCTAAYGIMIKAKKDEIKACHLKIEEINKIDQKKPVKLPKKSPVKSPREKEFKFKKYEIE